MSPTSNYPQKDLHSGSYLKKSDIAVCVVTVRSDTPPPEKKILKDLYHALEQHALGLKDWDQHVDSDVAQTIIRHVSSVRGKLSMQEIIHDIDVILKRVATANL